MRINLEKSISERIIKPAEAIFSWIVSRADSVLGTDERWIGNLSCFALVELSLSRWECFRFSVGWLHNVVSRVTGGGNI